MVVSVAADSGGLLLRRVAEAQNINIVKRLLSSGLFVFRNA